MNRPPVLLIVEDDPVLRMTLASHLSERYRVRAAGTLAEARTHLEEQDVELALLDLFLPDGDGMDLLPPLKAGAEVVVMTAFPAVKTAVKALRAGAADYITKPFELDALELTLERALKTRRMRQDLDALSRGRSSDGLERLVGRSGFMDEVRAAIRSVASAPDTTVLVTGESGTGKELVAQAIHAESSRRDRPFVRVDCGAIPGNLLEDELFGHERGAFTDARKVRRGLAEIADGGTLFLDEIGDLPLSLQPKLLRLLESSRFRRLGGNSEVEVGVRFVAATNRDLAAMVAERTFREDLWYRLRVFEIHLEPLRNRPADIAPLAEHFLRTLAPGLGVSEPRFDSSAAVALEAHSWPGNARELRNAVERSLIIDRARREVRLHLGGRSASAGPRTRCAWCVLEDQPEVPGSVTLDAAARRYVEAMIERFDGNKTQAAAALGISRGRLRRTLEGEALD